MSHLPVSPDSCRYSLPWLRMELGLASAFLLARLVLSLSELPKETTELKPVTLRSLWYCNVRKPALGH